VRFQVTLRAGTRLATALENAFHIGQRANRGVGLGSGIILLAVQSQIRPTLRNYDSGVNVCMFVEQV
jgi:hypothetical protein